MSLSCHTILSDSNLAKNEKFSIYLMQILVNLGAVPFE